MPPHVLPQTTFYRWLLSRQHAQTYTLSQCCSLTKPMAHPRARRGRRVHQGATHSKPSGVGAPCPAAPTDSHRSFCQTGRSENKRQILNLSLPDFTHSCLWKSLQRSLYGLMFVSQVAEAARCAVAVSSLWTSCRTFVECEDKV